MLTPEIKRGEIWYIGYTDTIGSEQTIGRPLIVLSSMEGCATNPTLNGVFLTTNPEKSVHGYAVELQSTRRKSWALTNQLVTVDRRRFKDKMCKATDEDILNVENSVLQMLGISREVVQDNGPNEKVEFEAEYYRRLYELTMDKLCETAIELEQLKRKQPKVAVEPVIEQKPDPVAEPKEEPEGRPEPLNINVASVTKLWDIGLNTTVTDQILKKRPFADWEDFRRKVNIPSAGLQILMQKAFIPAPPKKKKSRLLNINEATVEDLKRLGFGDQTAVTLTRWLRLHGPVTSYDDLEKVKRMGKQNMDKLRGKITF